jgi:hypothetical protein
VLNNTSQDQNTVQRNAKIQYSNAIHTSLHHTIVIFISSHKNHNSWQQYVDYANNSDDSPRHQFNIPSSNNKSISLCIFGIDVSIHEITFEDDSWLMLSQVWRVWIENWRMMTLMTVPLCLL